MATEKKEVNTKWKEYCAFSIETVAMMISIFDLVSGIAGTLVITLGVHDPLAAFLPIVLFSLSTTAAFMLKSGIEKKRIEYIKLWILVKLIAILFLTGFTVLIITDVIWIYQSADLIIASIIFSAYSIFSVIVMRSYYKTLTNSEDKGSDV